MIFGPKNSQRRELFREKFSNERDERKVVEKFEKYFEFFLKFFKKLLGRQSVPKTTVSRKCGRDHGDMLELLFQSLPMDLRVH